jgi:putative ABC transport system substrate-binding protein
MRRREFLAFVGGVLPGAFLLPWAASAQRPAKTWTIGYLASGTPTSDGYIETFVQRLSDLGWVEGRDFVMEYRWADGSKGTIKELAANLITRKADLVVTTGTPATAAVKELTTVTPVVFVGAADPVGTRLVASLARPGGNITGLSNQSNDVAGKRMTLLRAAVPVLKRLAILGNADSPAEMIEKREAESAARRLDIDVLVPEVRRQQDILPAFEIIKDRIDAVYVLLGGLAIANQVEINTWALHARLPTMHGYRPLLDSGGLMSYGANVPELYRRAAEFVVKILRGAKPGDIPVEQPTKFELAINLKTARGLGVEVSPALLALADEVIE